MPLVNIRVPEGSLSEEKKNRMIELVTDAVVEAEGYGDAVKPITWVIIEEIKDGNWGANGRAVKLDDLAKLVKGGREQVEKAVTPA
ncbi:MAG TPA: 4-oxalocrotonate tautomerase family protein [Thermoleophilaceae bacterium]|jgi:4-oxalocrotonate tautomerase